MSDWISFEDKEPNEEDKILLATDGIKTYVLHFQEKISVHQNGKYIVLDAIDIPNIKYWMKLPEPSK